MREVSKVRNISAPIKNQEDLVRMLNVMMTEEVLIKYLPKVFDL